MDNRYREYARLILNHSLQFRAGERVVIRCEPLSVPFAEVLAAEIVRAGGHYHFWFSSPTAGAVRLLEGTDEQLDFMSACDHALAECDCLVSLEVPQQHNFPQFDPDKLARRRRATAILNALYERRWVVALLPTQHLADQLGVSLAECEDLVLRATVGANWQEIEERALTIERIFAGGDEVRIVADGTDLRFSIAGRPARTCFGTRNLPDGETFYSPREETVEGTVTFHDPQITGAGTVSGIRLTFRAGRVVEWSAAEGQELLESIIRTDEGARYLGEFGIGVNDMVSRMAGNGLFDEKIAGTIHLALGNAYADAGGTNRSLVHWDLVLDLRRGGSVYVDDRLVCLDGMWFAPASPVAVA